jgi:DNA-binding winged helix-turn-helix (wHTH) protein/TolB-like protein/Flp pilus assembly protein TadD
MSHSGPRFYEFSQFRLDAVNRLLFHEGKSVPLTSKAFDILLFLIQNRDQVIDKEELMNKVWSGTIVEDINLTVHISALRKIFGENPNDHKFIVTVPKRGYGFVAKVTEINDANLYQPENNYHHDAKSDQSGPENISTETQEGKPSASEIRPTIRSVRYWSRISLISGTLVSICAVFTIFLYISSRKNDLNSSIRMPKSIAVLPFKTLNSNGEEYLELGMADALITRLSKQKEIQVTPTSAISNYTGQIYDNLLIGRKLGVEAIIQGTIQRDEKFIRVTVQMIRTENGSSMWADRFDENDKGIFAVQDSISKQITQALMLTLNEQENAPQPKGDTQNLQAYHAFLRGIYFWNKRSEEGLQKALQYFQQAIEHDSSYGRAYAMLGDTFYLMAIHNQDREHRKTLFENAKQAALHAIEIDETLSEAHTALAMVRSHKDNDMSEAGKEHERAIELNPNYATAHQRYGWYLAQMGQVQRATQEFQLAVELDPLSVINTSAWASLLYSLKQFDQSIELCIKALELDPDFDTARMYMALSYEQKHMYDKALEEAYKAAEKDRLSIFDLEVIGHIYAASGQIAQAQKCIQDLNKYVPENKSALCSLAIIYEGLGKRDQAITCLRKAALENAKPSIPISRDPRCESMVADKRFLEFQR